MSVCFVLKPTFFGYRRGGGVRGALSDWVIATDMLSEHESTFCIGCLTTNEDVGGPDFFSL